MVSIEPPEDMEKYLVWHHTWTACERLPYDLRETFASEVQA